jgi:hypothetical protein
MVTLVKHEWHQVDSQFAIEFTKDTLEEIYPDMDEDELEKLWQEVESGDADIDSIIQDAWDNDVELEWERQYDDWWTDRKGGYEITYGYGNDSSWHHEPSPPEPTHKCTNCKWNGQSYDAEWCWEDKEGNEIKEPRKICPYCESDVELNEHGIQQEKEREERYSSIKKELDNIQLSEDDSETEDSDPEYEELILSQPIVEDEEKTYVVEKNYPQGKYTVELRGRTLDAGAGSITEAQYNYWKDRKEDLGEALNDSFDYEENETPEECRLYEYYNEYDDIKFIWGVESDCWISIKKDDETIFEGDIFEFLQQVHGDDESYYEALSGIEEFYVDYDLKDKGPVVVWEQYGKGGWFDGLIEGEFDPKKLRFETIDFEGTDYINKVFYDDTEVDNGGGDYWGKYSDYNVYDIK